MKNNYYEISTYIKCNDIVINPLLLLLRNQQKLTSFIASAPSSAENESESEYASKDVELSSSDSSRI